MICDFPSFSCEDIPVKEEKRVLEVLEDLNISKSTKKSDIPAKVLNFFAKRISQPLTRIINNCLAQGLWPDVFKMEYVTPVKKVPNPKNVDLRLITQHYLIKMLDRILSVTDTKGECVAVLATLIDWKSAFPMQCVTLGVKSQSQGLPHSSNSSNTLSTRIAEQREFRKEA